ncbi:MAG: pantoate--beta-alanine ligase [Candidatus Coatesbacteria bacterium]|nr:MAG: pantoate--beta-alanine ligase [Candidatus Coatesbacteria bacterium]
MVETRRAVAEARTAGKTVGLVPTMGALHEGHLSLVRASAADCGYTVVSVFVNPTQFGPGEDLERYPRGLENDAKLAGDAGAELIFAPTTDTMYPAGYATYVEVERLTDGLCGARRPGHFRGVTTVVTKLFNICKPDAAYFGQKDAQQAVIIKRMVRDLDLDIEIRVLPTVREPDGLAMSSRNEYLSAEERLQATCLYRALQRAEELYAERVRSVGRIIAEMTAIVEAERDTRIDYISAVDAEELSPIEEITAPALVALAVFVGETRLIDNVVLG